MKDSKIKITRPNRILLTFFLLLLGFFQCWADDEFDPFNPDGPDPGNVEIVRLLPFLLMIGVFYAFRKYSKRSIDIESKFQRED